MEEDSAVVSGLIDGVEMVVCWLVIEEFECQGSAKFFFSLTSNCLNRSWYEASNGWPHADDAWTPYDAPTCPPHDASS